MPGPASYPRELSFLLIKTGEKDGPVVSVLYDRHLQNDKTVIRRVRGGKIVANMTVVQDEGYPGYLPFPVRVFDAQGQEVTVNEKGESTPLLMHAEGLYKFSVQVPDNKTTFKFEPKVVFESRSRLKERKRDRLMAEDSNPRVWEEFAVVEMPDGHKEVAVKFPDGSLMDSECGTIRKGKFLTGTKSGEDYDYRRPISLTSLWRKGNGRRLKGLWSLRENTPLALRRAIEMAQAVNRGTDEFPLFMDYPDLLRVKKHTEVDYEIK